MHFPATPGWAKQKPVVLVIEDEAGSRDALRVILRPFFTVQTADSARAAMEVLHTQPIDLITLDLKLPDRPGLELLHDLTQHHAGVEIIIITGYGSVQSNMEGLRQGTAGFLLKPFNVVDLLALVTQALAKKQRLDFLRQFIGTASGLWGSERACAHAWKDLRTGYQAIRTSAAETASQADDLPDLLPLLSDLLEAKDRQLLTHCSRVTFYTTLLANRLTLTLAERQSVALGAFLHDIGKIGPEPYHVADEDLALTGASVGHRHHPELGATLVLPLGLPAEVGQIIAYHHERWDGLGVPYGLQEEGIPPLVRIVCLAHTFDYLTGELPGRRPLSMEEACHQIRAYAGTHFDPTLTELFVRVLLDCKASFPTLATTPPTKNPTPP